MKKILAVLLLFAMALTLIACQNDAVEPKDDTVDVSDDVTDVEELPEETPEELPEELPEVIPEEIPEKTASPKEFSMGTVSGNEYKNEFIGLGFKLDDGWSFYSDEQIRELNSAAFDMAGEDFKELVEQASIVYDMFATDSEGMNSVNVNLEKMDAEQLETFDIAKNYELAIPTLTEAYENMGCENITCEIKKIMVDGEQVDSMSTVAEVYGIKLYQTAFQKKCDGYLANVTVATAIEDTTAELIDNFYWID